MANCRFGKDVVCHQCGKTGDLRRVCRNSQEGGEPRKKRNELSKTLYDKCRTKVSRKRNLTGDRTCAR